MACRWAGGTRARVTAPRWKQGAGPAGSVAITNACAGCGCAAISTSAAGSREVGAPEAQVHPALAPATALGKRQDWPDGTTGSHSLTAQTSKTEGSGGILVQCSPVT